VGVLNYDTFSIVKSFKTVENHSTENVFSMVLSE